MSGRKDLEGRLPIVYNGRSVEEWYRLYCQQWLVNRKLIQREAEHTMGVNIHLVKMNSELTAIEGRIKDWDSSRFVGDSDLFEDEALKWEPANFDGLVLRPRDIDGLSKWVLENVPMANQPRWLDAIARMIDDPLIYLWFIA